MAARSVLEREAATLRQARFAEARTTPVNDAGRGDTEQGAKKPSKRRWDDVAAGEGAAALKDSPSLTKISGRLVNRRFGYNRNTRACCVNGSGMYATHSPDQAATGGRARSPYIAARGAEEMATGDMGIWSVQLRMLVGDAMRNPEGLGSTDVRPGKRVSGSGAGGAACERMGAVDIEAADTVSYCGQRHIWLW